MRSRWRLCLILLSSLGSLRAVAQEPAPALLGAGPEECSPQPVCTLHQYHTSIAPSREKFGTWRTVTPEADGGAIGAILGMQTVHNVMLPSGKVLMISGSSWRNLAPIETFPEFPNPKAPTGLFVRGNEPFRMDRLSWYYQLVNNAAIYDPEKNTFYRIPHPVPVKDPAFKDHFAPNDFFCTGQMHLSDGNVLFVGGTQYYSPYRTGNRSTWIFDWKKELTIDWTKVDWRQVPNAGAGAHEVAPPTAGPAQYPWTFAGFTGRGRWYPSILPLLDGRFVVMSGYVGFEPGQPPMYPFEINHFVEFFDPSKFTPEHPELAWKSFDVQKTPNSPFATLINPDFKPTPEYASQCGERCRKDNQYDAFKLYPETYLMPDGRILFTREGDWVSLRTCDTAFMRKTKHTYWGRVVDTVEGPTFSFEPGPDRPEDVSSYGTSLLDPNSGKIEILGGQPTSPGTFYPLNSDSPTHFAGGQGSRKLETFVPSAKEPNGGHWTLDPDFLGTNPQDDRTMHYAVVLPTRQILIINGGNYDFYGPVFYPLMLTPQFKDKKFTGYRKERMADAVEPRLYHNMAMLLPDATVLVAGGNTTRATVYASVIPPPDRNQSVQPKPDLNLVDLDNYFFDDGPIAKGQKGMLTVPTEDWVAEIFSPPYLYIDGKRRPEIAGLVSDSTVQHQFTAKIGGKSQYLLHSGQRVTVSLQELPADCPKDQAESLVLIKLPSVTHGWDGGQQFLELPITKTGTGMRKSVQFETPDAVKANAPPGYYMLFYVDCKGKPSKAQMVRFDDRATAL
ncbi:MAG TPA: galactose oxidase early set domain-containing protein [Thermoanaerobaculia bacterium]|nr:galactose oxidase early set domain-containing protein [Thermoanaerobaculia bacterium]